MACALVVQEGSRLLENLLEVENRRRSWSLSQRGPGGRIVWSLAVLRRRLRIFLAKIGFEPMNGEFILLATYFEDKPLRPSLDHFARAFVGQV